MTATTAEEARYVLNYMRYLTSDRLTPPNSGEGRVRTDRRPQLRACAREQQAKPIIREER
jgi:hypothetical protein